MVGTNNPNNTISIIQNWGSALSLLDINIYYEHFVSEPHFLLDNLSLFYGNFIAIIVKWKPSN